MEPIKKRDISYTINYKQINKTKITCLSVTFNNNNKYVSAKTDSLITYIKKEQANLIFISNLSYEVYLGINEKLEKLYHNVQVFKTENINIGSAMFILKSAFTFNKSEDNPYYFDLENSSMERKIIGCEVIYNTKGINVIGIHLETGDDNEHLRIEQFNIMMGIIKDTGIKDYIIMGNFESDSQLENNNVDAWNILNCPHALRGSRKERIYFNKELLNISAFKMILPITCSGIPESMLLHNGILCSFSIN